MHVLGLSWDPAPATHTHSPTFLPGLAMPSSFFRFQLKYSTFRETLPDCPTPQSQSKARCPLNYPHSTLTSTVL